MPSPDPVRDAYNGLEGRLYELMLGELLHVGGLRSSLELAERAQITEGMNGIDLCCGNGASMRLLVQLVDVASMTGVDFSEKQVERTSERTRRSGLDNRIRVVCADATDTGLPGAEADFVWGEDAWCYVPDKSALVAEAVRLVRPGGVIAFTDWTTGETPLTDTERSAFFAMLRLPSLWSADDYTDALEGASCEIIAVQDTGRLARGFELYARMFDEQLGWDLLEVTGHNRALLDALPSQLDFIADLGRKGKLAQTRIVARRLE
jgi:SAM-dependent methyltransferase